VAGEIVKAPVAAFGPADGGALASVASPLAVAAGSLEALMPGAAAPAPVEPPGCAGAGAREFSTTAAGSSGDASASVSDAGPCGALAATGLPGTTAGAPAPTEAAAAPGAPAGLLAAAAAATAGPAGLLAAGDVVAAAASATAGPVAPGAPVAGPPGGVPSFAACFP
jgi:hypothetical protein